MLRIYIPQNFVYMDANFYVITKQSSIKFTSVFIQLSSEVVMRKLLSEIFLVSVLY
jgi:hypothetical protein